MPHTPRDLLEIWRDVAKELRRKGNDTVCERGPVLAHLSSETNAKASVYEECANMLAEVLPATSIPTDMVSEKKPCHRYEDTGIADGECTNCGLPWNHHHDSALPQPTTTEGIP